MDPILRRISRHSKPPDIYNFYYINTLYTFIDSEMLDVASKFRDLWARVTGKQEGKIIFMGLDAAGKTTILYWLRLGEVVTTIPTIGGCLSSVSWNFLPGSTVVCCGIITLRASNNRSCGKGDKAWPIAQAQNAGAL